MLINIILSGVACIGFAILLYFMLCIYKQHKESLCSDYIELFPKKDIYAENAYEGDKFHMTISDKKDSERWAAIQRGSVRIACGAYFTSDEYIKYRERVLEKELP